MVKKLFSWMSPVAVAVLCAGLFGAVLVPSAKADAWNQRTTVTINQPVEVPGTVLTPGTYTFKLWNSNAERQVVQVYNEDGTRLIATFMGVPIYRETPSGHTILRFNESAANSPQTLHEWFYPGDNYGLKFNYPQSQSSNAD